MKPTRKATYEDVMKVPDTMVAEIVDGELITNPRPALPHARTRIAMASALFDRFDGPPGAPPEPGGWWILYEPELHFGEDILVPDVAGWRRERMAVLGDIAAVTLAPDWVCEIISPSTARIDRQKMRIYAREGVAHLWIVDPLMKTIEIYRREGADWLVAVTHAGDEPLRAEPFDAVELDVARWWRRS